MSESQPLRPRGADWAALSVVLLFLLGGALYYPIYHRLYPLEWARSIWRDTPGLVDRLQGNGPPLWSNGKGRAIKGPFDFGPNLSNSQISEIRRGKEGRFYRPKSPKANFHGWVQEAPSPDERYPSLDSVPRDPWGQRWWVHVSWAREFWGVRSAGPDGVLDTEDDLQVFLWHFSSWHFHWPLKVHYLTTLLALLCGWAYLVFRARGLPYLRSPGLEVVRAVVVVSPLSFVAFVVAQGVRLPHSLDQLTSSLLVPQHLALTLTATACMVGWVVWRRTTRAAAEASDES